MRITKSPSHLPNFPHFSARPMRRGDVFIARRAAAPKAGPVKAGEIPERLQESSYWDTTVKRLLQLTGAPSYKALQDGVEIVAHERHPAGELPIYFFTNGVACAGHPGNADYVFKLKWPRGPKGQPIEFYLGLECAANLRFIPAKYATSAEVKEATRLLQEQENLVAELYLQKAGSGRDGGFAEALRKAEEELGKRREKMRDVWLRDNRRSVEAYNEAELLKAGPALRERLFAVEMRAVKLADSKRASLAAVVRKLATDLRDIHSYAEGVRRDRVFLMKPLVEEFNRVYEMIRSLTPALVIWPSFDMGMRTFERYVEMEGDRINAESIFDAQELALIERGLAEWRKGVDDPGSENLPATDIQRLRTLYDRMPRRGFVTRQTLLAQYPRLESQMRMVKEDRHLIPDDMCDVADFLGSLLDAYGPREVSTQRERLEPQPRNRAESTAKAGGRPAIVTEAPFTRGPRRVFGKGEKVGRVPEADLVRFQQLAQWLEQNYRSAAQIREEFPDIDRWIVQLEAVAPSVHAGSPPKAIGKLIANADEWHAVEKRVAQWRDIKDHEKFPRHAALKFQDLVGRKASRGVRKAQIEGLESLVERLQFGAKGRKAWKDFAKAHRKQLPPKVRAMLDELATLLDTRRETLTLDQVRQVQSLEVALAEEYQPIAGLDDKDQHVLAVILSSGDSYSVGFGERSRFLAARGYLERDLVAKVREVAGRYAMETGQGDAPSPRITAAQTAIAGFAADGCALGPDLLPLAQRAIAQAQAHRVLSAEQAALLDEIGAQSQATLFRSHLSPLRWHVKAAEAKLAEIVGTDVISDGDRLRIAADLNRRVETAADVDLYARGLAYLRSQMKGRTNAWQVIFGGEQSGPVLARLETLVFGFSRSMFPDQRLPQIRDLEAIARVVPNDEKTRKAVAYQYLRALADVYRKRGSTTEWDFAIRDATIASMRRLLEADPQIWKAMFNRVLNYGETATSAREGDAAVRMQRSSKEARQQLAALLA